MFNSLGSSINEQAQQWPAKPALAYKKKNISYQDLSSQINNFAHALIDSNVPKEGRVGVYLPKQPEAVIAMFGAMSAGACMVPINPALKAQQVMHILNDCEVCMLVTSSARLQHLAEIISHCPALKKIILVDDAPPKQMHSLEVTLWDSFCIDNDAALPQPNETDTAAIFYTSGSSGKPKGVVLSHKNLGMGAKSVAEYLKISAQDRILAVLPLSFDYGFSQLTTALISGSSVILLDYLFPKDIINAIEKYKITGLAGIPTLWFQLAKAIWPRQATNHLRYISNSGAAISNELIEHYSNLLPSTEIYLMYGLTEAFRSTYLKPDQLKNRPGAIGKAIPNAEIFIINDQGQECEPNEVGELVHTGPLVAKGYWNRTDDTKQRFRPLPSGIASRYRNDQPAVWSGDLVKKDSEGYIYFVARQDEMIKTSGYRISPQEVEQAILETDCVQDCAVFAVPDKELGQVIIAAVVSKDIQDSLEREISSRLTQIIPAYMIPKKYIFYKELPMGVNGKVDKNALRSGFDNTFKLVADD